MSSVLRKEMKRLLSLPFVLDAHHRKKLDQIGTASHADVLTIVDRLA
jgi:UV DNA damage repair endonuclease